MGWKGREEEGVVMEGEGRRRGGDGTGGRKKGWDGRGGRKKGW